MWWVVQLPCPYHWTRHIHLQIWSFQHVYTTSFLLIVSQLLILILMTIRWISKCHFDTYWNDRQCVSMVAHNPSTVSHMNLVLTYLVRTKHYICLSTIIRLTTSVSPMVLRLWWQCLYILRPAKRAHSFASSAVMLQLRIQAPLHSSRCMSPSIWPFKPVPKAKSQCQPGGVCNKASHVQFLDNWKLWIMAEQVRRGIEAETNEGDPQLRG